ncbi:trypsin-like peptidase domain-containing protein [Kitasatospora sp. NPDC048722]|uniref:trypsin-like peptidase domain-containing protein n=1 Tax=Kitasatospora sp. NPDC048722 TaxID=3155639 RepID=UPI0033DE4264
MRDGAAFLGSGFLVAPGLVLTAAHVARRAVEEPAADGWFGRAPVIRPARRFPAEPGEGRFHAFPDLALLTLAAPFESPSPLVLDTDVPPPGTAVLVAGFTPHTPTPGIHGDSLLLTVAGPAAGYVRLTGDEVRDGFSGGMVIRLDSGAVCGVLKGSRDFDGVRGGWFTPLSALAEVLSADDPLHDRLGRRVAERPLPTARDLLPVLLRVRGMDDPDFRRLVVRTAEESLATGPLHVSHHAHTTDHLLEVVQACLRHREPAAALAAVTDALELLRLGDAAVDELRTLTSDPEGGP